MFFRSPDIQKLTQKDWELSIPLFQEYVNYINPKWTVLLGKTGVTILNNSSHLDNIQKITVHGKDKKTNGYTANLFGKYPLFCVPHPQARISRESRYKIWNQLFQNQPLIKN